MNWSVTYRSKDGGQAVEVLEADSREALFKVLSEKGITAIRIEQGVRKRPQHGVKNTAPKILRCVFVVAILVALAIGAWYFLTNENRNVEPPINHTKPSKIVEVTPAPASSHPIEEKVEPVKVDPNARPTKVGEVVNGYVLLPSGRMHKRTGVITNTPAMRPKGKYAIFARRTDNEIAGYLSMNPGDTLVGTPRYNGRFERDFLESLKEPILITDEDTPKQAELKQAVIAARKDLKDAYDRGESVEQIMLDTRSELQAMMRYKNELKQEFNKLRKGENITDQDVEDLFNACNLMLEEKGIAPMKFGPITRRRMQLSIEEGQE